MHATLPRGGEVLLGEGVMLDGCRSSRYYVNRFSFLEVVLVYEVALIVVEGVLLLLLFVQNFILSEPLVLVCQLQLSLLV